MIDINKMIEDGKLKEAAAVLFDALMCIINEQTPQMDITRGNWAKVTPKLIEAMQNPTTIKPEPTEDPGDDIEILDKKAQLTITYEGPDDEDFIAPKAVKKMIYVGATYNVASPLIEGYEADKEVVTGKMTEDGADVTVKYTKAEPVEETGVLTITYVGPEGDTEFVAPAAYEDVFAVGTEYNVPSPEVEGYAPDKEAVTGTMTADGADVTVAYVKNLDAELDVNGDEEIGDL